MDILLTCEEVEWKSEWFSNRPKYNRAFWKSSLNQKAFFEEIAAKYKIEKAIDWQKATVASIKLHGGRVNRSEILCLILRRSLACMEVWKLH